MRRDPVARREAGADEMSAAFIAAHYEASTKRIVRRADGDSGWRPEHRGPRGEPLTMTGEVVVRDFAARVRVVGLPRCDWLSVTGPPVDPRDRGFVEHEGRWWRPGWTGQFMDCGKNGLQVFTAKAMKGSRTWPQPWGLDMWPTRVDVACDITGFEFNEHHRSLFTTRGSSQAIWTKHEVQTMYIGSRRSPVMLRIYKKSELCDDADRDDWSAHGWRGEPVWRVEYELKKRALTPELVLPFDVERLWCDSLSRVRMCAAPPRTYSRQNKAPTHPVWAALGQPAKCTRRRSERVLAESTVDRLKVQLERLFAGAGVARSQLAEHAQRLVRTMRR